MEESGDTLAWYRYPEPAGRAYTARELEDAVIVEQLFDYCQLLLAFISARGWEVLLLHHGIDAVLAISRRSGWLESADDLRYQCLISGYDPEQRARGRYSEETGIFSPEGGQPGWAVRWEDAS